MKEYPVTTDQTTTTEDEALDAIVAIWADAAKMRDEADEMEAEARDLRFQGEELLDQADEAAAPLIESHPEWREAIEEQRDPRA